MEVVMETSEHQSCMKPAGSVQLVSIWVSCPLTTSFAMSDVHLVALLFSKGINNNLPASTPLHAFLFIVRPMLAGREGCRCRGAYSALAGPREPFGVPCWKPFLNLRGTSLSERMRPVPVVLRRLAFSPQLSVG